MYLGVYIDAHLNFDRQVQHVCDNVNKKLAAFRHGRRNLTTAARRIFYISIIRSTLEYASNAYYHSLSSTLRDRLVTTSQIAMRKVFGLSWFTATDFMLRKFSLHSLDARVNLKLYVFTFRCLNARASPLLTAMFHLRSASSRTSATTRGQTSNSLCLPRRHSRIGFHSVSFLAAVRWNALPLDCRVCANAADFLRLIKLFLFS